jgi:hypothetical protein
MSDIIVRGFLLLLSVVGQFLTLRELVYLLFDLLAGTLDSKFYLSLAFATVVFPVSFMLLSRALDAKELMGAIFSFYAFALSILVVGYYSAIQANYIPLVNSISASTRGVSFLFAEGARLSILILFAVFLFPIVGLRMFLSQSGGDVAGVAALPLLAAFLWGCYQHLHHLRQSISEQFVLVEVPQMAMTAVLIVVGSEMIRKYLKSS